MTSLFIAIHAIAAIALIGPVMVSTSMFPPAIAAAKSGDTAAFGTLRTLSRITGTYGMLSALVPVLGICVFIFDISTYASQRQFHASIALAIIAWGILLFMVAPKQKAVIEALGETGSAANFDFAKARKQLAMFGGIFNLLWIICAILMFI